MTAQIMFITTHALNDADLPAFLNENHDFAEFLEASEPSLIDLQIYVDKRQTEATFVLVFADAEAADDHLRLARQRIGRGLEIELEGSADSAFGLASAVLAQQARGLQRARAGALAETTGSGGAGPSAEHRDVSARRDPSRRPLRVMP